MDVENFEAHLKMMERVNKSLTVDIPADQTPPGDGRSIFMDAYAMGARWHMNRFGSTQRQLAAICAKNHWHGSLNPLSQYQMDMSIEDVLADKPVAYPLTRAMCAPVGDGAAAAIVCSEAYLKNCPAPVR
jgi:acetyl-CoA acyltransferase